MEVFFKDFEHKGVTDIDSCKAEKTWWSFQLTALRKFSQSQSREGGTQVELSRFPVMRRLTWESWEAQGQEFVGSVLERREHKEESLWIDRGFLLIILQSTVCEETSWCQEMNHSKGLEGILL